MHTGPWARHPLTHIGSSVTECVSPFFIHHNSSNQSETVTATAPPPTPPLPTAFYYPTLTLSLPPFPLLDLCYTSISITVSSSFKGPSHTALVFIEPIAAIQFTHFLWFKHLGAYISADHTWTKSISYQVGKAQQTLQKVNQAQHLLINYHH